MTHGSRRRFWILIVSEQLDLDDCRNALDPVDGAIANDIGFPSVVAAPLLAAISLRMVPNSCSPQQEKAGSRG